MVAQLAHARETLSPTLPPDWFGPVVDAEPSVELLEPERVEPALLSDLPSEPPSSSQAEPPGVLDDVTPADPEESRSRSE